MSTIPTSFSEQADTARTPVKRFFDVCSSAALFLVLLPLFGVIAIGMALLDRGPIFFQHQRLGQGGRRFGCLKFRTMRVDAAERLQHMLETDEAAREEWLANHKLRNDPRVTPIGNFLRRTSLDELPQIINVLRGEMSLVGPRPIVDAEIPRYGDAYALYMLVKPGITGLWQVSGRSHTTYVERVRLDSHYALNRSLLMDLSIILRTPLALLEGGAY